jgi:hypothetical protein
MELSQKNRTGDAILSLASGTRSLENGILASGNNLQDGAVLGQAVGAAGTKISGTGDGAIGAVTVGPDVEIGTYVLTCTAESANAGTFSVTSPSGNSLAPLTVAVAYAGSHINLTVADGANDWDVGDVIHVVVTAGKYSALNLAATDGSQTAAAVLYGNVNAADADAACVVIARDAEVKTDAAIWPDGITADQLAAATSELNSHGIYLR